MPDCCKGSRLRPNQRSSIPLCLAVVSGCSRRAPTSLGDELLDPSLPSRHPNDSPSPREVSDEFKLGDQSIEMIYPSEPGQSEGAVIAPVQVIMRAPSSNIAVDEMVVTETDD